MLGPTSRNSVSGRGRLPARCGCWEAVAATTSGGKATIMLLDGCLGRRPATGSFGSAARALAREQRGQEFVAVLGRATASAGLLLGRAGMASAAGFDLVAAPAPAGVLRLFLDRVEFEVGERTQPRQ